MSGELHFLGWIMGSAEQSTCISAPVREWGQRLLHNRNLLGNESYKLPLRTHSEQTSQSSSFPQSLSQQQPCEGAGRVYYFKSNEETRLRGCELIGPRSYIQESSLPGKYPCLEGSYFSKEKNDFKTRSWMTKLTIINISIFPILI